VISQSALIIEAALLTQSKPLSIEAIVELLKNIAEVSTSEVRQYIDELNASYENRSFNIQQVASGYRIQLREDYAKYILPLFAEKPQKYSRALLETLALIAYKQPITRGEIEDVRGVGVSSHIIRTLLERNWIRIVGYREVPGRPAMLATTRYFLDYFNIKSLADLPPLAQIKNHESIEDNLAEVELENQQNKQKMEQHIIDDQQDNTEEIFSELANMEKDLVSDFVDITEE
jgi:segregation and condensation protein B